jgi:hypothetical protein
VPIILGMLTQYQRQILEVVRDDPRGHCDRETLLSSCAFSTPQTMGKAVIALSRMGLVIRTGVNGNYEVWLTESGRKEAGLK